MRFLVDENLPARMVASLSSRGADVSYVPGSLLASAADDALWEVAAREARHFCTGPTHLSELANGTGVR